MTVRIFKTSFCVGIAVMIVTIAMFMSVLYSYYSEQTAASLRREADYAARGIELSGEEYFNDVSFENRVTWVSADGEVLYDNEVNAEEMENHSDRQEIIDALNTGYGTSVRYSSSLSQKTVYYAERLGDGTVVRLSAEQFTVGALLISMQQPLIVVIVLSLLLSFALSARLAKSIVKPINEIDLDNPVDSKAYDELAPLLSRIARQNRDISAQIEEMSRKQREFTTLTENMSEGFILIDSKARVISNNSAAANILCTKKDMCGEKIIEIDRSREFRTAADEVLEGKHCERQLDLRGRTYQLIANPIMQETALSGAVLLILDVTEREQMESMRREFTANVSHELKTPLTSIIGFAELMKDGIAPYDDVPELAGDIYSEGKRLITLVEDIMHLSQLDEGYGGSERENVNISELARDVIHRLAPAAQAMKVTAVCEGENVFIRGSHQILEELIYNLCDNGIKYNKKGGSITVKTDDKGDRAVLTVSDTGIGIPTEDMDRVFERFYRVDKSHSKSIGGTGLGLSIVKHAAAYHNAEIRLDSRVEKGTTVTVIFPLTEETASV